MADINDKTIDFIYIIVDSMMYYHDYDDLSGFISACLDAMNKGYFFGDFKINLCLTLLTATLPVASKITGRQELLDMVGDPALTKGL